MLRRRNKLTAAVCVFALCTGCSYSRSRSVGPDFPEEAPMCSMAPWPAVVDFALYLGLVLAGFELTSRSDSSAPLYTGIVLGAPFAGSAAAGIWDAWLCSSRNSTRTQYLARQAIHPPGSEGGDCFADATCARGYECDARKSVCRKEPDAGTLRGVCLPNQTCERGLRCDTVLDHCIQGPPAGVEGGVCYGNGTCDGGLTCHADLCAFERASKAPKARYQPRAPVH